MNKQLKSIGEAIRANRKAQTLSQMALGEICGLHRSYICDVERGVRNLTYLTLVKVAGSLKLTVWELVRDAEVRSNAILADDSNRVNGIAKTARLAGSGNHRALDSRFKV